MQTLEQIHTAAETERAHALLIHGAWGGAWIWQDGFAQRLAAQGVSTTAVSLRGHGKSWGGDRLNRYRLRDYVEDVRGVLEEQSGPVFLVGHSMGGGIVQQLLARTDRPTVAGAVLLASLPPAGVWRTTLKTLRETPGAFAMANLTFDLKRLVSDPDRTYQIMYGPNGSREVADQVTARLQGESFRAFLDMLAFDRPKPKPGAEPVLVVGAEHDAFFPPVDVAATARAWETTPVMMERMGHDLTHDTGWEKVADTLATWMLERVD